MNNLPESKYLPIEKLAGIFNNTSATYKFYWFLAIIDSVEKGKTEIEKEELFIKMLGIPWYTVNYFNISFGSQDLIQRAVKQIILLARIPINEKQHKIFQALKATSNPQIKSLVFHFDKNVPHWFLSPWYSIHSKKEIYRRSANFENNTIYALEKEKIIINPKWTSYLKKHSKLLKDYTYWNLTLFLQTRNPNVPDIPNKLIRPAKRNSLQKQRNSFWNKYLEYKTASCIFTGKPISKNDYALDHFVPYAFVSHDLIWNLIPIDSSFNSSKNNKLPPLERYFNDFYELQKDAFLTLSRAGEIKKYKEDYLTIFPNLENETGFEKEKFRNAISPLITIANNNGFEFLDYD